MNVEFLERGCDHVPLTADHRFATKNLLILFPLGLNHFHHSLNVVTLQQLDPFLFFIKVLMLIIIQAYKIIVSFFQVLTQNTQQTKPFSYVKSESQRKFKHFYHLLRYYEWQFCGRIKKLIPNLRYYSVKKLITPFYVCLSKYGRNQLDDWHSYHIICFHFEKFS